MQALLHRPRGHRPARSPCPHPHLMSPQPHTTVRQRMSVLDEAWLRLDAAGSPRIIVALLRFDGRFNRRRFEQVLREHLLAHDRFRQRPELGADGAFWCEHRGFALRHHLDVTSLPASHRKQALERTVQRLLHAPLAEGRPLWHLQVLDGDDRRGSPGWSLVARIHHCLGDGLSLVSLLAELGQATGARSSSSRPAADTPMALLEQVLESADPARWLDLLRSGRFEELWRRRLDALEPLWTALRSEVQHLITARRETPTRLRGPAGLRKQARTAPPFDAAAIRRAAQAWGCTSNELMLAALAGALREHLLAQGDSVDDAEIRVLVPASLRRPGESVGLGNRFGMLALMLPIGIAHPLSRVVEVQRRMRTLKRSMQPTLSVAGLWLLARVPSAVRSLLDPLLELRASAVVSHVPGPRQPLQVAGATLREATFWVVPAGDIALAVSILGYAGRLHLGLVTDRTLISDARALVAALVGQVHWLVEAAPTGRNADAQPA